MTEQEFKQLLDDLCRSERDAQKARDEMVGHEHRCSTLRYEVYQAALKGIATKGTQ